MSERFLGRAVPVLALGLGVLLATSDSLAGNKTTGEVTAYSNAGFGSVGGARNSADTTQYIECSTAVSPQQGHHGFCTARDASGTTVGCFTSDANMIRVLASVNASSYIYFRFDTATGECSQVTVKNSSRYPPPI
jgi:hypothetical protein